MITLTTIHYSEEVDPPLRLYVYEPDGRHRGGNWFRPRPQADELSVDEAERRAAEGFTQGRTVQITNGNDHLVFDASDGRLRFPASWTDFWRAVRATT